MKKFKFKIKGNKYEVEIKDFNGNIADIEINGTLYNVEVEHDIKLSKTPTLVRSEVQTPVNADKIKKTQQSSYNVTAPLPGNIMNIFIKEGDTVKADEKLMMMEAMKMENIVKAERGGTIKSVKVSVGSSVLQGDVLIEIG